MLAGPKVQALICVEGLNTICTDVIKRREALEAFLALLRRCPGYSDQPLPRILNERGGNGEV